MAKKNRIYRLTVGLQDAKGNPIDKAIIITNPIGISFNVTRGIYAQRQQLDIDIYNLNDSNRRALFRDVFKNGANEANNFLICVLEAGYEDSGMSVVFAGFVWSCYTKKNGVNAVTHIQANTNLGEQYAAMNVTLKEGQTLTDIYEAAMRTCPYYTTGKASIPDYTFIRPVSIADNAFRILSTYTGKDVFVDLMKVYVLGQQEAVEGYVPKIDFETGLLGAPERQNGVLSVNVIFEPRIVVGQIIEIKSSVAPEFNGQYKVFGITHQGEINDAGGGRLTTRLDMQVGTQIYGGFNVISQYK
ncbi:MAG: hypothetical protein KBT03_09490 [Bacteroidales bacterium]|nr:hypothetical protein [Candidatus Scybalousia scybalohippi]